ncbi:hypothetical protein EJB05_53921, partial [Eragrostis curvula]
MKFPVSAEFRFGSLTFVADGNGDLQQVNPPEAQEALLAELVASINLNDGAVPEKQETTSSGAHMPFGFMNSADAFREAATGVWGSPSGTLPEAESSLDPISGSALEAQVVQAILERRYFLGFGIGSPDSDDESWDSEDCPEVGGDSEDEGIDPSRQLWEALDPNRKVENKVEGDVGLRCEQHGDISYP